MGDTATAGPGAIVGAVGGTALLGAMDDDAIRGHVDFDERPAEVTG
jgi:hypothetical protein